MPDDLVSVYATTSEPDALATYAALNAEGIPAQLRDTPQCWLRWMVETISPRQILVPSAEAGEAKHLIERWRYESQQAQQDQCEPRRHRTRGDRIWRSLCMAVLWAILTFFIGGMLLAMADADLRWLFLTPVF